MKKMHLVRYALLSFISAFFPFAALAGEQDIFQCTVNELHPTQLAVGLGEVQVKERKLKKLGSSKLEKYLKKNPEPTVRGPGKVLYIVDRHHLARALADIGAAKTYCTGLADYSSLGEEAFWRKMEENKWVYPYDEKGAGPQPYSAIPDTVAGLKDDPYRTLAWGVREAGGYEKNEKPFSEFKWADFFRNKISQMDIADDFNGSVKKGVKLAHSPAAAGLPGYLK